MNVAFRLYVCGDTTRNQLLYRQLATQLQSLYAEGYELRLVDVLLEPDLADEEAIVSVPTLVRCTPPPPLQLVGDLSNAELISKVLG